MVEAAFVCLCGRSFQQEYAYGKHQRCCQKTKKRLSGALSRAKELWNAKRQKRTHDVPGPVHSKNNTGMVADPAPDDVQDASSLDLYGQEVFIFSPACLGTS
jgi:hypothetical protein